MLRDAWPYGAGALIIVGVAAQNGAVAALGFAVLLACGAAMLWARWSLRRLTYERYVPEDHAFTGERLAVTLRMTNRKLLPLPWIEARDHFPEPLVTDRTGFAITGDVKTLGLEWRTSAGAYERVGRELELRCPARGVYSIGPVDLRSGDAFGLFSNERTDERRTHIVVYPKTVDLGNLALPAMRPYGDAPRGVPVFEDPARVAGIRDYRPGDSLRRVDWHATARLGKMQSRVYEPTSSQHLLVCLNTQTVTPSWSGWISELLERSIVVAASIARDAYDRRYSVGLLANSTVPDADRSIRIAPGRRPEQFIRMLEALAVITPFVLEPMAAMLDREEHALSIGTTVAIVSGIMPPELAATALRLRRRGHQVVVLSTSGEAWPDLLGDIPVRDVSAADQPWREAPS
ncbi:MAG: DUF58 domain-containing protein [Chloroflexota bacterium]|nr:DUF58 domain-containing protein [Chloroflexota bacterium]